MSGGQPVTRAMALRTARDRLVAAGVQQAESEARALLRHASSLSALDLVAGGDAALGEDAATRLESLLGRRLAGEPVGRIIGLRSFWGLDFALSPDTLEPRDDSEAVIAEALALLGPRRAQPLSMLDLGLGSGCLLVAMLHECQQARGLGVDISQGALDTAVANAARNGVADRFSVRRGNWAEGINAGFDLVLSNPPYIRRGDIPGLSPEVRLHDPLRALDGGDDGLDAYRTILAALPHLLLPGGAAVLEIGAGQEADISALAVPHGLACISRRADLGGHVRALGFRMIETA